MTPQELFIKFGNDQFKKHNEVPEEIINDPEIKFIFDAMEAYGKQEYNQAIDDLVADNVVADKDRTILKFKKL
jgi:hypothetical protein